MKKIFAIIIIVFAINTAYSQIFIGFKAGLNMSSASTMPAVDEFNQAKENISDFVPKFGGNAAVVFIYKIKSFSIQPELSYNTKGLKADINQTFNDTILTGEWNYTLHYFEVPLMFKYVLGAGGAGPFIELGGYYGYMFAGKYKENYKYGEEVLRDESRTIDDSFENDGVKANRHEFGFKVGLGAEIPLNGALMFVSLRFSQGLTDVVLYETKPDNYEKSYNRVFQLSVAYMFEVSSNEEKVYYY